MLSKETLTKLLKEAQAAHHRHEKDLGRPDAEWAEWYATYIVDRLQ